MAETQRKCSVEIPTEPGLYWASCLGNDQYDSVLAIYGKSPFLKKQIVLLPIIDCNGFPLQSIGLEQVRAVGSRFVIPGLGDK